MASGMGMPSMGIYSYELFKYYDVDNIIRIGSAGSISDKVDLRDIVLAIGTSTDSNYAKQYNLPGTYAPVADFGLLNCAYEQSKLYGIAAEVGNVVSTDVFIMIIQNIIRRGVIWVCLLLKWNQRHFI